MKIFFLCMIAGAALAQVAATVNINPSQFTPLNANFSGFNDEVPFPPEFYDYRLNDIAAQLSPGWLRYPSGLFSDAFDWQTGLMVASWAAQFQSTNIGTLIANGVAWCDGKGGGSFVDAANRAYFFGAKLIVDVNAYTDTPESAGAMAAFARANGIRVGAWELANEPYLYKSFFASGIDYVTQVKPYRDAIKAADPDAVVAVFFDDSGDTNPNPPWDTSIASYPDPYWDAVTFHSYPAQSTGAFSQWMADENGFLATKTSAYVSGHLEPLNPPGTKFLISEFLPSNDGLGTGTSVTDGTLYGAIYGAEFVMRMSSVPSMIYVGPHALTGIRGVDAQNAHYTDVQNAYDNGTTIDTLTLDFGYYLTAQQLGVAVLNGVLTSATQVLSTTVTGGATVPATGPGAIPALYAQAYASAAGKQSVVITNKSATVHQVTIESNGAPVTGTLPLTFIAGTDPATQNTGPVPNISIETSTSSNPVTIPAYSVVRVDLNSPPVLTAANSASYAAGTIAPQEIVTLFNSSLPAGLSGNAVQITDSAGNTQPAQVFVSVAGVANVLIPAGVAPGTAKVAIQGTNLTGSVTVASSAPGLYSMNSDGAGVAAADAFFSPSNVSQTVFNCNPSYARSCLPSPLAIGSGSQDLIVVLYGTGIRGASSVQCFVAGQSVPVIYAGADSLPGLDQVNISVPAGLAGTGDALVYIVADGVTSNVVSLAFK